MTNSNNIKAINAANLLADRVTEAMRESTRMRQGDHWLGGRGFIGEINAPVKFFRDVKNQVREGFIFQNVIEEICERKTNGIIGREPLWGFIPESHEDPTERQKALIKEAEAALTKWWNESELLQVIGDALELAYTERRAGVRPFVSSAFRDETGSVTEAATLDEALKMLNFEAVAADTAGVFREPETYQPYSVFKTIRDGEAFVDISFTDEEGLTHFKTFKEPAANEFLRQTFPWSINLYAGEAAVAPAEEIETAPLDLKGKLHLYEFDLRKVFITEAMKSAQKELNLAFTMKGRNINLAGSRERYITNARSPKEKVRIPDATQIGGYREEKQDAPLVLGAGRAIFLQGSLIRNERGEITGAANPNVSITDPVDVKSFLDTIDKAYASILAAAQQLHVMMNDSAAVSGKSRKEARAEFEKSLKKLKTQIDALIRWMLEYALSFAAVMCGRAEDFREFRCDANAIVDAGMPDPDERAANINDYNAGVISKETLQSRNGVEDTDAENSRIVSDPAYEINQLQKILEVLKSADGKVSLENQMEILGRALGWDAEKARANLARITKTEPAKPGVGSEIIDQNSL